MSDKVIKILLVEDDPNMCIKFENETNNREDVVIAKTTNSSNDALKLIKNYDYDAIIVDLELHFGTGSGFELLKEMRKINKHPKPLIIVNTNVLSEIVYDNIHAGLADMIFYKKQEEYSVKLVIDTIVSLSNNISILKPSNTEHIEDKNQLITELINSELDLIGISYKLKGREYIFNAIFYMLKEGDEPKDELTVFQYLSKYYKLLPNSISRAIQTAINDAWRKSAIEDLKKYYTAKVNYNTGVPTPTEFIYYYEGKIRKMIENH